MDLGRSYLAAVHELAQGLGIDGSLDLSTLLTVLRDVIVVKEQAPESGELWNWIEPALEQLLDGAEAMARSEGTALERELESRISGIEGLVGQIAARSADHLRVVQQAMRDRIQALLTEVPLDEARLAQETTILADRLDITEEIVRTRSHVEQFKVLLAEQSAVGRRLDFLLQELFREINTTAAKSSDSDISHLVVELKSELEKMREQVQNVV
jgi:uncharacterized protein (TIGR00255 family)